MSKKINIYPILCDHINTLKNNKTKKISRIDLIFSYGMPIIPAAIFPYIGCSFGKDMLSAIISSFSIFVGLLINVLVLIYTIINNEETKNTEPSESQKESKKLLIETFYNISYAILISFISIFFSLIPYIGQNDEVFKKISHFVTPIIVFLVVNFFWTFTMTLKRLHILLNVRIR